MTDALGALIFNEPYGRMMSACGQFLTDDPAVLTAIGELGDRILSAKRGEGDAAEFVSLYGGGPDKSAAKHLHLTVANAKFYGKSEGSPEVTATAEEIAAVLAKFASQKIKVQVTGRFATPLQELSENSFIKKTMLFSTVGDLTVRQTRAAFEIVSSQPVKSLDWFVVGKDAKRELRVEVRFDVEVVIDSNYGRNLHEVSYSAFTGLVKGV